MNTEYSGASIGLQRICLSSSTRYRSFVCRKFYFVLAVATLFCASVKSVLLSLIRHNMWIGRNEIPQRNLSQRFSKQRSVA